jgi:hypothetical protein
MVLTVFVVFVVLIVGLGALGNVGPIELAAASIITAVIAYASRRAAPD